MLIGDGDEARLNDEVVRVRDTRSLRDAVMLYTDFIHVGQYQNGIAFQQLMGMTNSTEPGAIATVISCWRPAMPISCSIPSCTSGISSP